MSFLEKGLRALKYGEERGVFPGAHGDALELGSDREFNHERFFLRVDRNGAAFEVYRAKGFEFLRHRA